MALSLEHYRPAAVEYAIEKIYAKHRISAPSDIRLEVFVEDMEVWVHEMPRASKFYSFDNQYTVIIDNRLPDRQRRVELAHELGHVLMHAGRQDAIGATVRHRQEWQADRFALYALAPTFMISACLEEMHARNRGDLIEQLSDVFEVPMPFMDARMETLESRVRSLEAEHAIRQRHDEDRAQYDYTFRHPTNPRIEYLVKDGQIIGRRLRADI